MDSTHICKGTTCCTPQEKHYYIYEPWLAMISWQCFWPFPPRNRNNCYSAGNKPYLLVHIEYDHLFLVRSCIQRQLWIVCLKLFYLFTCKTVRGVSLICFFLLFCLLVWNWGFSCPFGGSGNKETTTITEKKGGLGSCDVMRSSFSISTLNTSSRLVLSTS